MRLLKRTAIAVTVLTAIISPGLANATITTNDLAEALAHHEATARPMLQGDDSDISEAFHFGFEVTEVQENVRGGRRITSCSNANGTCHISEGHTVSATVSGGLGVTVGLINAELGASYEETHTDRSGCSETYLSPGEQLVLYPTGDFVFFKQGWLNGTAFLPTGTTCIVESTW